jgi:hypothetical protein
MCQIYAKLGLGQGCTSFPHTLLDPYRGTPIFEILR